MHSVTTSENASYPSSIMLRESLLPASCSAAMAVAAVTPEAVPPLVTSRLPAVSFISAILLCRIATYTLSSPAVWIGAIESAPRFPFVWTNGLVQSAYSSSFTAPSARMKKRGVAAASVFLRIAWFIRSICFCGLLHRSTYPYPAGVPSSGNSTSNTNGYLPWSYQPRSAMLGPAGTSCVRGCPFSSIPTTHVSVGTAMSFSVA